MEALAWQRLRRRRMQNGSLHGGTCMEALAWQHLHGGCMQSRSLHGSTCIGYPEHEPGASECRMMSTASCMRACAPLVQHTHGDYAAHAWGPRSARVGAMPRTRGCHAAHAWGPCTARVGAMQRARGGHAPRAWGPCTARVGAMQRARARDAAPPKAAVVVCARHDVLHVCVRSTCWQRDMTRSRRRASSTPGSLAAGCSRPAPARCRVS
eukprot:275731-Chlamydomonas_euryale.AAC.2